LNRDQHAHIVIGTAGHIDHGKTTLVKALTGRNLDTLDEEMRRGITISPGFTWLDLPNSANDVRVGLVDVPGHEKFIKNMIAGATGIDFAMLVVAANDGVKPQTLEHLWILETLGLRHGVIALTKCGIADDIMVELAEDDISATLKGTFLEKAEIVRVDSISGFGIPDLRTKLAAAVNFANKKNTSAPARINVDRVFTKKGFGVVVTGTVTDGVFAVGDDVRIYPQGEICKIRGIQNHENAAIHVAAGQRAAINLAGTKITAVKRGDILSAAQLQGSVFIDVKLRIFPGAVRPVKFWDRLRLYIGTREIFCRVVPLTLKEIKPGEEDFCQLRIESGQADLFCKKDDHFVIRHFSPMETVGGGIVANPNPTRHSRMTEALQTALLAIESGCDNDIVLEYIKANPGKGSKVITDYTGKPLADISDILHKLENSEEITQISGSYFHSSLIGDIRDTILEILGYYHKTQPLKPGMPKSELCSKVLAIFKLINQKQLDELLTRTEREGLITLYNSCIALHSFEVKLSDKQKRICNEIEKILIDAGFAPPTVADLTGGRKEYMEALTLLAPHKIIFLEKNTVMHTYCISRAKELLLLHFAAKNDITLAQFRDLLGTSRKFAQLIIEKFDNERITIRTGDTRILRK